MGEGCRQCRGPGEPGALCAACERRFASCRGLLPEHVIAAAAGGRRDAALVDPWGRAHPLIAAGTLIGRSSAHALALLHDSVSRDHARLRRVGATWEVADLGSKNGTRVDGSAIAARTPLADGAAIVFGQVPLVLWLGDVARAADSVAAPTTALAADRPARRFVIESDAGAEIALVTSASDAAPGAALFRSRHGEPWVELALSGLAVELLLCLARRAAESGDGAPRVQRCVPTRDLARHLPFRSSYATEDNVRQTIRRVRSELSRAGVSDLIESSPPHGYRLAWQVRLG